MKLRRWFFALSLWSVTAAALAQPMPEPQVRQERSKPQVLFSGPPAAQKKPDVGAARVTDAERKAVVITAWNLDVHLAARQSSMEAHSRLTLRNQGNVPLKVVPLQLSSTLNFELAASAGRRLQFSATTVASDVDHTGQLHEAAIQLPQALPPAQSTTLDVDYGGPIPLTAQRLTAIGAPAAEAEASDWDRIGEDFTGLRGFGNVVWYPVSSVPVSMAKGAELFTEIGRQKLLDQDATISLRVTEEFFSQPPTAAVLDGHYVALDKPVAMPTAAFPGVVTCSLAARRLGFEVPSLFIARRTITEGNGVRVLATQADAANAQGYITAGSMAEPLVKAWLGRPATTGASAVASHDFTVLDLPEPDDAPAETGAMLATPLRADAPSELAGIVAHGLAHAAFYSPRGWLNEGVANFLGVLWIESTQGRTAALERLNADRPALALAEPGTPGQGGGEDLLHAVSAVYYRTKATYVLWMLRQIAGEKPLQTALHSCDPAQDTAPDYFEHLLEQASGKDLRWFFDNWVYQDRGLPDLSIAGVYPSPELHQQILVAVDIVNAGYAEAEVPVTVKGVGASLTSMVRVPAHGRVTHRMTFQEQPTEVDVNDGSVPEVQDSIHRMTIGSK
jgi:hypothetical protein